MNVPSHVECVTPASHRLWLSICILALVSSVASAGLYLSHSADFFTGDDFELIADALAGVSIFEPVSSHLRPMARLHFALYHWFDSALFFGGLSLLLHFGASVVVFLVAREMYGKSVAVPASLLFFSFFAANEAVFWASAAPVLYCMIFSGLSLVCFIRGRLPLACVLLIPAAMSYELWMVVPLLFVFYRRSFKELIVPFALVGIALAYQVFVLGGDSAASYGGISLADFPSRFARFLSPLAENPPMWISLPLSAFVLCFFLVRRFRPPATIYAGSALILSLSFHVSSRYYYFPALAVVLVVAIGICQSRKCIQVPAALLAIGLALTSPWVNALDGRDYERKSEMYLELYAAMEQQFNRLSPGDRAGVINRLGPERLEAWLGDLQGRPKLVFVRGPAVGGMIDPEDAARMALYTRGLYPEQLDECSGAKIEVGRGEVRALYCFEVAEP